MVWEVIVGNEPVRISYKSGGRNNIFEWSDVIGEG